MCYNLNTSILTYIIGLISGLSALYTGQIILGWFILFYVQIQLAEGIIWYGIDNDSKTINSFGTTLLKYLLATHVIGIGVGIYLDNGKLLPLLIGIGFFLCIVILYHFIPGESTIYPKPSGGRLIWKFPINWYMVAFFLILGFYWMYSDNLWSKIFLCFIYTATLLWAIYGSRSVGSIWCWLSAILTPFIVGINYIIINKL